MPFVGDSYLVRGVNADYWSVQEPLAYMGQRDCFTIPVDFVTDFTTVPRVVTWLIPRTGIHSRAAILHDYLCVEAHQGRFSRADADGIFRRVLREYNVPFLRRWMMWAAVRAASRLRHASFKELVQFSCIVLFAVPFLLIPSLILLAWTALFWMFELPWRRL